jgi:MbtH protein
MFDETEGPSTYVVVVNHEEQYSVWPTGRPVPLGWKELATRGTKQECLAYIKDVWTDMRPLSLRRAMDGVPSPAPKKAVRSSKSSGATAPARGRKAAPVKKAKRR